MAKFSKVEKAKNVSAKVENGSLIIKVDDLSEVVDTTRYGRPKPADTDLVNVNDELSFKLMVMWRTKGKGKSKKSQTATAARKSGNSASKEAAIDENVLAKAMIKAMKAMKEDD